MHNRYASVALLCFMMWIVGQALINIAVVVEILPVMGVPLPFVSARRFVDDLLSDGRRGMRLVDARQPQIGAAHSRA